MNEELPRPLRCPECNQLICSHFDSQPTEPPVIERKTIERNIGAILKARRDEAKRKLPDLSRFPL